MASDNGDLETQEDALDQRMRSHERPGLPDGLLDRCLSTIPRGDASLGPRFTVASDSSRPATRAPRRKWKQMTLAASFLLVCGTVSTWSLLGSRFGLRMERALSSAQYAAGQNEGLFPSSLLPSPKYLNDDVQDGIANSVLFSEGEVPSHDGKLTSPFRTGGYLKKAERPATPPASGPTLNFRYYDHDGDVASAISVRREPNGAVTSAQPQTAQRVCEEALAKFKEETKEIAPHTAVLRLAREGFEVRRAEVERLREGSRAPQEEMIPSPEPQVEQKPLRAFGSVLVPQQRFSVLSLVPDDRSKVGHRGTSFQFENEVLGDIEQPLMRRLDTEAYHRVPDNPFWTATKNPLSTFSIDVDTASYSNVRRFLNQGMLPPREAVRIEELVNYFTYNYPQPQGDAPFSVNLEVADCPWNGEHRLVRIGLKGKEISDEQRPPTNLVFLIDVSGSMQPANRLPLLKTALKLLVERLTENDRVAIVTYAGTTGVSLPSTCCDSKESILSTIERLQAGGSTNGGAGIQLAYEMAVANFIPGGVNRVILGTDGDFNVGITDRGELIRLIEERAKTGVFLSVLGFGMGNLKDATMEKLADKGNGNYAYIDNLNEARKVLVDQVNGTLVTIAKDVKIQVEFNPAQVSGYRLIGYENRIMRHEDFNDDRKDAGEIGAGHTVTALYEIVPSGKPVGPPGVDPLKYRARRQIGSVEIPVMPQPEIERPQERPLGDSSPELLTIKLRYKQPDGDQSKLLEVPLTDSGRRYGEATTDFKFASAVAAFGMILRGSEHRGTATLDAVLELAEDGLGTDREGYRSEFVKLVRLAKSIQGR